MPFWIYVLLAAVLAAAVFYFYRAIFVRTNRNPPIDRLTPVHIDIRGENPWEGEDKVSNYLRLCRRTQITAIVLGFFERGLTRPGLLTTGEYSSLEDVPDEMLTQIECASWAREFDLKRTSDQRLFNSWLYRMVRRLKAEADAHFASNIQTPMEVPDWFKSVLDFAVAVQGSKAAYGHVEQHMHNAGGEASNGKAKGTATFGSLNIQIRAYVDGVGKKAIRRESSFALQRQS